MRMERKRWMKRMKDRGSYVEEEGEMMERGVEGRRKMGRRSVDGDEEDVKLEEQVAREGAIA